MHILCCPENERITPILLWDGCYWFTEYGRWWGRVWGALVGRLEGVGRVLGGRWEGEWWGLGLGVWFIGKSNRYIVAGIF